MSAAEARAAAESGDAHTLRLLLAQPNAQAFAWQGGISIAHLAAYHGRVEALRAVGARLPDLLRAPAKGLGGAPPAYLAAQNNHDDALSFLHAHGAISCEALPNGWTVLHIAAEKNSSAAMWLLLREARSVFRAGLDVPNPNGHSPLCVAAKSRSVECARQLIDAGADVAFVAPAVSGRVAGGAASQ